MRAFLLLAALAGTSLQAQAAKEQPNTKPAEKRVCHTSADTGTLIERKVCKTRAQWAAESDEAQRSGQALVDRGAISSCGATTLGGC